jgi:hypothetical protein
MGIIPDPSDHFDRQPRQNSVDHNDESRNDVGHGQQEPCVLPVLLTYRGGLRSVGVYRVLSVFSNSFEFLILAEAAQIAGVLCLSARLLSSSVELVLLDGEWL